jgi:hypothetical protein
MTDQSRSKFSFNIRLITAAVLLSIAGCNPDNNPPAQTPQSPSVFAVLHPDPVAGLPLGWINVGRDQNGQFEILPGARPGAGVKLYFYAPWPGLLHVTIDGTDR